MKKQSALVVILPVVTLLACAVSFVEAGHSRHSYVDGGQSMDGRFVVTPRFVEGEKPKKGDAPFHWEYQWKDTKTGKTITGRLEGLRSGRSNVFDPVGSHLFVAPDGETFALWTPQVMMQAEAKKPEGERDSDAYRNFDGFSRRLVIYRKTGEIVKQFDLKDFLKDGDWQWFYLYGRQNYWLLEYPGLDTRSAPRPFYALYQISPDYTVLEFRIGANAEATHKAKERNVTPPQPRTVRIRLTDGELLDADSESNDPLKRPGRPFVGELADKTRRQNQYVPSLDPVRKAGRYESAVANEP